MFFPHKPLVKKQKRRVHLKPVHTVLTEGGFYPDRIGIKFTESHKIRSLQNFLLRLEDRIDVAAEKELHSINDLLEKTNAKPYRVFERSAQKLDAERIKAEQVSHQELEDLNAFHTLYFPRNMAKEELENLIDRLNRSPLVEIAYPKGKLSLPVIGTPAPTSSTPLLTGHQGYLGPAGVNILAVWDSQSAFHDDSRGEGIRLTDIELGWDVLHEDLAFTNSYFLNSSTYIMPLDPPLLHHGTSVLGELIGADNSYGVTGISNQVEISLYGIDHPTFKWDEPNPLPVPPYNAEVANAINTVSANPLRAGDVMLLELQMAAEQGITPVLCAQWAIMPVEYDPDVYTAIQNATATGRIVIEAAANGGFNLNNYIDPGSGAIIVGAATSTTPHKPLCFSNYGARVDLHGWGENVFTTGSSNLHPSEEYDTWHYDYTARFAGTSSASPMVAGAAAVINGYYKETDNGRVLDANAMRQLLKNTGTAQSNTNGQLTPLSDPLHLIGEMPNIHNALLAGLPVLNVKINGYDNPPAITYPNSIHATINIEPGGLNNLDADWWVRVDNNGSSSYLNSSLQWTSAETPLYQGGLFAPTGPFTVFNGPLLPGSYTLYFAIDTKRNGVLDLDYSLFYDSMQVQVN